MRKNIKVFRVDFTPTRSEWADKKGREESLFSIGERHCVGEVKIWLDTGDYIKLDAVAKAEGDIRASLGKDIYKGEALAELAGDDAGLKKLASREDFEWYNNNWFEVYYCYEKKDGEYVWLEVNNIESEVAYTLSEAEAIARDNTKGGYSRFWLDAVKEVLAIDDEEYLDNGQQHGDYDAEEKIVLTRYGEDDFSVFYEAEDFSLRGSGEEILEELREHIFLKKSLEEMAK